MACGVETLGASLEIPEFINFRILSCDSGGRRGERRERIGELIRL